MPILLYDHRLCFVDEAFVVPALLGPGSVQGFHPDDPPLVFDEASWQPDRANHPLYRVGDVDGLV